METLTRFAAVLLAFVLSISLSPALADVVVPSDRVMSSVVIRAQSSSSSASLGSLRPGESLPFIDSVPSWNRVRLSDGKTGFVSKSWTEVVPDSAVPLAASTFKVHFLDVGTGDSAIIDMGKVEIVIDGGDSKTVLSDYATKNKLIDGSIELLITTHGDTDHWNGLPRLLGFDKVVPNPPKVSEFWDAGYNRDCNPSDNSGRKNYLSFIEKVRGIVPNAKFKRPLENHHVPATKSGTPQPFTISTIPGVTFTLLHSDASPSANDCSYAINNASIVLMIEIEGVRILFTGDANGKERNETSPGTPGHVEAQLLKLEAARPGTLKADVLKVPHHGSETASTQAFINAVDPKFVIISASTKHHLPKSTVVTRYTNNERVILRTDAHRENNKDHIICEKMEGEINCNYADVLQE